MFGLISADQGQDMALVRFIDDRKTKKIIRNNILNVCMEFIRKACSFSSFRSKKYPESSS
jgi:hypothetical protein